MFPHPTPHGIYGAPTRLRRGGFTMPSPNSVACGLKILNLYAADGTLRRSDSAEGAPQVLARPNYPRQYRDRDARGYACDIDYSRAEHPRRAADAAESHVTHSEEECEVDGRDDQDS